MSFLVDPFRVVPFYPAATLSYVATVQGPSLSTNTSIPDVGIGAEDEKRRIVAVVQWGASPAVALLSATIGGVSATIDASLSPSQGNNIAIVSADVPTGTTATVDLDFEAVSVGGDTYIATYAAYGLKSGAPIAVDTASGEPGGPSPRTFEIETKAGGVLVCGFSTVSNAPGFEMNNPMDDFAATLTEFADVYSSLVIGGMTIDADETAHQISLTCSPSSPQPFGDSHVIASYR